MAQRTQRKVKRQTGAGKQSVLATYNDREWYELPVWAREFVRDGVVWVDIFFVILLAPAAMVAIVLGFHALPLEFLGVSASANSAGLAVFMLLLKFILLALAIRPLWRHERKGWLFLITAAAVHFAHSLLLRHAISGGFMLLLTLYCYTQTKRYYHSS